MAVLSGLFTFNNGDVIDAPQMNTNFTQVKNFVENLSAGTNFDAGAIGTSSIADNAITAAKLASSSVTSAKIAASVALTTPDIGAAIATSIAVTGQVTDHPTLTNVSGSSYTLALVDDGRMLEFTSGSAVTLTVPQDSSVSFPTGTKITLVQIGSGQVTVGGAGVTIQATPGLKLRAQYSSATLIKRAAANTWLLIGDLSA